MISIDAYRRQWTGNIRGDLLSGFVNALAILIFLAQLPELDPRHVTWITYPLVALGLAIIYLFPYLTRAVPSPLVTIVVLTALTLALGLDVRVVGDMGALPDTLPVFLIPDIPLHLETLWIILPYSVAIAVVGLQGAGPPDALIEGRNRYRSFLAAISMSGWSGVTTLRAETGLERQFWAEPINCATPEGSGAPDRLARNAPACCARDFSKTSTSSQIPSLTANEQGWIEFIRIISCGSDPRTTPTRACALTSFLMRDGRARDGGGREVSQFPGRLIRQETSGVPEDNAQHVYCTLSAMIRRRNYCDTRRHNIM